MEEKLKIEEKDLRESLEFWMSACAKMQRKIDILIDAMYKIHEIDEKLWKELGEEK